MKLRRFLPNNRIFHSMTSNHCHIISIQYILFDVAITCIGFVLLQDISFYEIVWTDMRSSFQNPGHPFQWVSAGIIVMKPFTAIPAAATCILQLALYKVYMGRSKRRSRNPHVALVALPKFDQHNDFNHHCYLYQPWSSEDDNKNVVMSRCSVNCELWYTELQLTPCSLSDFYWEILVISCRVF